GAGAVGEGPLERPGDRVGGGGAPRAAPAPRRRVEGGEELAGDLGRARVHAAPWRRSVEDGGGAGGWWRPRRSNLHQPPPTSTNLHHPPTGPRSTMRDSSGYPGVSGRW